MSEGDAEAQRPSFLDWAVAGRPLEGKLVSGDRHVLVSLPAGELVAVIDGLGHAEEAAAAAQAAASVLERHAQEPPARLLERCHARLIGTRGVVMSLAIVNAGEDTMTWLGVGNVEAVLLRSDPRAKPAYERALLRGGALGCGLPPLRASILPIARGDILVFATDGIGSGFTEGLDGRAAPLEIACSILAQYGKRGDDALVLVARYLGRWP